MKEKELQIEGKRRKKRERWKKRERNRGSEKGARGGGQGMNTEQLLNILNNPL